MQVKAQRADLLPPTPVYSTLGHVYASLLTPHLASCMLPRVPLCLETSCLRSILPVNKNQREKRGKGREGEGEESGTSMMTENSGEHKAISSNKLKALRISSITTGTPPPLNKIVCLVLIRAPTMC